MREPFELCCKIIGLILVCAGVLTALHLIPRFFYQLYPAELFSSVPQGQAFLSQLEEFSARLWRPSLAAMGLQVGVPIALGLYLMRSNNAVVRYCYPATKRPSLAEPASPESITGFDAESDIPSTTTSRSEQYAPPEYFQGKPGK